MGMFAKALTLISLFVFVHDHEPLAESSAVKLCYSHSQGPVRGGPLSRIEFSNLTVSRFQGLFIALSEFQRALYRKFNSQNCITISTGSLSRFQRHYRVSFFQKRRYRVSFFTPYRALLGIMCNRGITGLKVLPAITPDDKEIIGDSRGLRCEVLKRGSPGASSLISEPQRRQHCRLRYITVLSPPTHVP